MPPIISEFNHITTFPCQRVPLPTPDDWNATLADELLLPFPSKLLPSKDGNNEAREQSKSIQLGVWRTPEEFVQEALAVEHPFDGSTTVSDDAKFSIFALLTEGRENLQETRERTFQYYESVKHELAAAELRVHSSMDPDMERLISDKQCLRYYSGWLMMRVLVMRVWLL